MNLRGEVLMERQYRDDVTRQMAAAFKTEIVNGKDRGNVPVVNLGSCTFMYKREQNVYIVAVTRANANAMLAFTFLGELVDLFKSYFGKLDENALKQNFVIIYELPDEILDHASSITSARKLQSYITRKASDPSSTISAPRVDSTPRSGPRRCPCRSRARFSGVLRADVQEERGVPTSSRVCRAMSPKGTAARAPRGDRDEMFPIWHARA